MNPIYHLPERLEMITLDSINSLLKNQQIEDSYIDYKGKKIPRNISDSVCSFLNSMGGHIVFGMQEKGNIPTGLIGIRRKDISSLNDLVVTNIRPHYDAMRNSKILPLSDGSIILILYIPRNYDTFFYSKGRFYVRIGDSSKYIGSEDEINHWKKNHPEKSDVLTAAAHKLRANPDLLKFLEEGQIDYIPSYVNVLLMLLPYELPGIVHGIPRQIDKKILKEPEITTLRKHIEDIYRLGRKKGFQAKLQSNWEFQRVWFMAGNFWFFTGEWEKAKHHYEVLDQIDPIINEESSEASFDLYYKELNKGVVHYSMEELDLAFESFSNALKFRPNNIILLNNIGAVFGKLNDEKRALNYFEKVLKINPRDPLARGNKGIALEKLKKYEKALKEYETVLKIQPDNIGILNNKGVVLKNIGKYKKAIRVFDRVISIRPDYIQALVNRGAVLQNLGKQEEALIWHENALEIKPDYGLAWYNKGSNLQDLKKYDLALQSYEKAMDYSPELTEPYINKISILIETKEFDKALAFVNQSITRFPDRFELYVNKMTIQIQLGQYKEAEETFQLGHAINQKSAELYGNKALILHHTRQTKEALKYCNWALKLNPNRFEIWYLEAVLYFQLQEWRRSYQAVQKALKLNPNHFESLELEKKITVQVKHQLSGLFNRTLKIYKDRFLRKKS